MKASLLLFTRSNSRRVRRLVPLREFLARVTTPLDGIPLLLWLAAGLLAGQICWRWIAPASTGIVCTIIALTIGSLRWRVALKIAAAGALAVLGALQVHLR